MSSEGEAQRDHDGPDAPAVQCPKCEITLATSDTTCPACGSAIVKQKRLGDILVQEGLITEEQLQEAVRAQNRKLGEILLESGVVRRTQLTKALKLQEATREPIDEVRLHLRIALLIALILSVGLAMTIMRLEAQAAQALKLEKGALSTDEVAAIFADENSPYKFEAMRSLAQRLKEPRSAELLAQALRSDKWYLQLHAAMLSAETGNKALVDPLIPLLLDPAHYVAPAAQEALKKITGQTTIPPDAHAWRAWAKSSGLPLESPGR